MSTPDEASQPDLQSGSVARTNVISQPGQPADSLPPHSRDPGKCPVCGSDVDGDAYHCPTCHNYYCFRCRARLIPSEIQLQCVNQSCDYYGKLICNRCDPQAVETHPPTSYEEPLDGYWPAWLLLALVVSAFTWYFGTFLIALLTAILLFTLGGLLLQALGLNIWGRKRVVEQRRTTKFHTCVACHERVKEVDAV